MKKLILISIAILLSSNIYPTGPPNPNCMPLSPCWCQQNPGHPQCIPIKASIEEGIWILMVAGLGLAIYYRKKTSASRKNKYE